MATRHQQLQYFIRRYKEVTGKKEVDMHDVAAFAVQQGWKLAPPPDPLDRLAQELARAAREEVRRDKNTGKPYRANHVVIERNAAGKQLSFWIDIDENPPRKKMHQSLQMRREQMVGDGLQLSFDADHWNSSNPTEEPIALEMDLTLDIEWRKNAPDEDDEAA